MKNVLFLLGSSAHLERYEAIANKLRPEISVSTIIIEKTSEHAVEDERYYSGPDLSLSNQIIFTEEGYIWNGLDRVHTPVYTLRRKITTRYIQQRAEMGATPTKTPPHPQVSTYTET
ncbi:MAG: hypothetical protein KBB54_01270 [Candidatus Pacebacteria bacterium]|nr:hypothetical protein [Candidatus Paceibacterota bacterium]